MVRRALHNVQVSDYCQLCYENYKTNFLNNFCDSKNAIHNLIILIVYILVDVQRCDNVCFTVAKVRVFLLCWGVKTVFMGYKLFLKCCFSSKSTPYVIESTPFGRFCVRFLQAIIGDFFLLSLFCAKKEWALFIKQMSLFKKKVSWFKKKVSWFKKKMPWWSLSKPPRHLNILRRIALLNYKLFLVSLCLLFKLCWICPLSSVSEWT